ncbi:MAG: carboxypeptidase-like regulatory domain-containing protein, partial [Bacteroidia bacterium]|nr:carboxypeptidase-like regulatory domain-containing protein [Bacteroidia bacterium]
ISFRHWSFEPTYDFGYLEDPSDVSNSEVLETFQSSEVSIESRWARDEFFIINDNERLSLGTDRWPVVTVKYTHGFQGVFGSDFDFDKLKVSIRKKMRWGRLGYSYLTLTGENTFNTLPYPMLSLHLGNQSPVYSTVTYNLMNYGEFASDHFASLQYQHYLEGLFLNRIPLIKKLNWRLLGTVNAVVGGLRQPNRDMISEFTSDGIATLPVGYFTNGKPYVELGYGVENIFRFLRVDFVHRMTYLDNEKARKFGVLFTAQFQL